jgi:non-canonical purine NTP pyrophosphatase (RdgB/HAM1 family)
VNELIFITGNQHKADFLSRHLGMPVDHHKLDLDELQSLDIHAVVEHKVRAYAVLCKPVVVEDAGLIFTAMGRLPGTFVKWFIQEIGNKGLAQLAASLPSQSARGIVCYGLFDGKKVHLFDGEMYGRIADKVRDGGMGFGYDAIFINEGFNKTRAEMSEEEYARTSYRMEAIEKMRAFLTER